MANLLRRRQRWSECGWTRTGSVETQLLLLNSFQEAFRFSTTSLSNLAACKVNTRSRQGTTTQRDPCIMSQTQPRPSDASSIQDTQAAWMTETQNRAAAKSSSRDASWSSTTAPATNNVNKTSGSSGEPAPAQHSPTIALDHSLPSHDSSGPESLLVDALKGIPDVTRDDIAQSQDTYPSLHGDQMPPPDASFSQLPHVPQSTAPQIHRHQGSQVLQLSAPSSDAPQDPSDDGGSRSMELTEMRSGKPKDPSRPSNNSHKSEISSSQRNSQSQSLPDDTQVCGSPELPPMAESTRNSRPQYGRMPS